jgi:hypothetical protein
MGLRTHLPVFLGEYWMYALAGVISITTLMLLYSQKEPIAFLLDPTGLLRYWW